MTVTMVDGVDGSLVTVTVTVAVTIDILRVVH